MIQSTVNQTFSYSHVNNIHQPVCVSVYIADPIYPKRVKRIQKGTRGEGWIVRVVCHEHQVIDWIVQSLLTQPSLSQYALIKTALVDATDVYRIYIELAEDYIPRSSRLNMTWYRRIWTLATRAHLISFTGVYYSVLGGAFCSLGKDNRQYASIECPKQERIDDIDQLTTLGL
ncbi:hypothetical protein A0J61_02484 [Choanephora cucurbitarum]|uniref:Uncharacterized protein n=1 Tax=Choanephora cucurbitarum TaxID=101091 RepID=A0A1C7NK23_9FUNG|nr:hypothetical protein A0J61_02484 [Choanephora cucurbitarum]